MGRLTRLSTTRRVVGGTVVAGLLALPVASMAQADEWFGDDSTRTTADDRRDGPFGPAVATGPGHYFMSVNDELPPEGEASFTIGMGGVREHAPDSRAIIDGEYTFTIDATDLKGVAEVKLPCDSKGSSELVAVCTAADLYPQEERNESWGVRVAANDSTEVDDTGTIRVYSEKHDAGGAPGDPGTKVGPYIAHYEMKVAVGAGIRTHGVDHLKGEDTPERIPAGSEFTPGLSFRNHGAMAADRIMLWSTSTRGISFAKEHGNCSYAVVNQDEPYRMKRLAKCVFEGSFEPHTTYQLANPPKMRIADFAKSDVFTHRFLRFRDRDQLPHAFENATFHQGEGSQLKLEAVPGDKPESGFSQTTEGKKLRVAEGNQHELELTGDKVSGGKGDTVTAQIGAHNRGPAWLGPGPHDTSFIVEVPKGATVTRTPEQCDPENPDQPTRFWCDLEKPLLEEDSRTFDFQLRIDKVVEGAKGVVKFPDYAEPNDKGWIVLNGRSGQ